MMMREMMMMTTTTIPLSIMLVCDLILSSSDQLEGCVDTNYVGQRLYQAVVEISDLEITMVVLGTFNVV